MSNQPRKSSGSGNLAIAFILGAVVVAVALLGWVVLGGDNPLDEPDVSIELPGGGAIEGEIEGN